MNIQRIAATSAMAGSALVLTMVPAYAQTAKEDSASTRTAVRILRDAGAAHAALVRNDAALAGKDVDAALAARENLAKTQPRGTGPMIVPVYAEFDETMTLADAIKNRTSKPGAASSAAPTGVPLVDRSTVGELTFVGIDLDKTKARLDAARTAIANKNDQAAEDSLSRIGDDLVVASDATQMPLLTARENIGFARQALGAKQYAAASTDLRAASASLRRYTQTPHATDAHDMAAQIEATLASGSHAQPAPSLSTKVDDWWTSVKGWFATHT